MNEVGDAIYKRAWDAYVEYSIEPGKTTFDCIKATVDAALRGIEPVAEVVWFDPRLCESARPGKIIDASLAFIDTAPIGTKLYAAPVAADPPQTARGPSEPLQCLRCGTIDAFGPVSKKDTHQWMKP